MPSYDFTVDLESLVDAAVRIAKSIDLFRRDDVNDLTPSRGDLGSHEAGLVVWMAVNEFESRWNRGMTSLMSDVESMAGVLGEIATGYVALDRDGAGSISNAAAPIADVRLPD